MARSLAELNTMRREGQRRSLPPASQPVSPTTPQPDGPAAVAGTNSPPGGTTAPTATRPGGAAGSETAGGEGSAPRAATLPNPPTTPRRSSSGSPPYTGSPYSPGIPGLPRSPRSWNLSGASVPTTPARAVSSTLARLNDSFTAPTTPTHMANGVAARRPNGMSTAATTPTRMTNGSAPRSLISPARPLFTTRPLPPFARPSLPTYTPSRTSTALGVFNSPAHAGRTPHTPASPSHAGLPPGVHLRLLETNERLSQQMRSEIQEDLWDDMRNEMAAMREDLRDEAASGVAQELATLSERMDDLRQTVDEGFRVGQIRNDALREEFRIMLQRELQRIHASLTASLGAAALAATTRSARTQGELQDDITRTLTEHHANLVADRHELRQDLAEALAVTSRVLFEDVVQTQANVHDEIKAELREALQALKADIKEYMAIQITARAQLSAGLQPAEGVPTMTVKSKSDSQESESELGPEAIVQMRSERKAQKDELEAEQRVDANGHGAMPEAAQDVCAMMTTTVSAVDHSKATISRSSSDPDISGLGKSCLQLAERPESPTAGVLRVEILPIKEPEVDVTVGCIYLPLEDGRSLCVSIKRGMQVQDLKREIVRQTRGTTQQKDDAGASEQAAQSPETAVADASDVEIFASAGVSEAAPGH